MIKIKKNISLKNYTSFKIGGPAKYFFIARNKEDLIEAIKFAKKEGIPFFILGEGSNLLVSDKGFNGIVIKILISGLKTDGLRIVAQAGSLLKDLAKMTEKKSLTGMEWAAGIPGTIGGAIYGNAGAFGFSISDFIQNIEVLDSKTLRIKIISKKDCKFFNKESIFKHKKNLIILSVIFDFSFLKSLKKKQSIKEKQLEKIEVKNKIKEYLNYRKKTQPFKFSSAGCAFKNKEIKIKNKKLIEEFPELKKFNKRGIIPAAFLIEKSGLKGERIGNAKISEEHSNFIINMGNAKAKDVLALIKLAKTKVKNKFKIILEEEIIHL
ncbi:MAG: UDP-N-acetylmuramate dehydrogenase [Patescibacteria group bacterium]|nr:UDP-N-acetylmuramate dehydrogenase [Patescibacteria group bacterium]